MADTYILWLVKNASVTTTTSFEIPDIRNSDSIIVSIEAGGQSGTNPTLDLDVEIGHSRWNTTTEDAYWTRVQTKNLGSITSAQSSPVFTAGDLSLGTFTQITSATSFTIVQTRGLDILTGDRMRVTYRIGGSASPTFTNVHLYAVLKANGVESSGVS